MLVVANWKAYVEAPETAKKLFAVAKRFASGKLEIVLAPAAPQLGLLAPKNKSKVAFAAQDLSATTGGPHTGEVSAQILAGIGAKYVIVGHSERRAMGETDSIIAQKLQHAIAHGLTPILCVGEAERDSEGKYLGYVRGQITAALEPLAPKERGRVILAYEPLYAIGKDASAAIAPHDLAEMTLYIRKVLAELYAGKHGKSRVLYGGSVEAGDVRALATGSGVDGFLVGHASADPLMFSALLKALI